MIPPHAASVLALLLAALGQGSPEYIAQTSDGTRYVLWVSPGVAVHCGPAVTQGGRHRDPCAQKIGVLEPGIAVERLDGGQCRTLVFIRVLEGALKEDTGCVASVALTSVKP